MKREEAIKILKELLDGSLFSVRNALETLIPELAESEEQNPVKLNDDTEVGLDRALQIVKAARGNLSGYQTDDGVYECDHAIQTLECLLKSGIVQKPSEEDEKRIKQLIYDTEHIRAEYEKRKKELGESFNDELIKDCDVQIAWLKLLLLRISWKPSEEQMKHLKRCFSHEHTSQLPNQRVLESLYNDLEKL